MYRVQTLLKGKFEVISISIVIENKFAKFDLVKHDYSLPAAQYEQELLLKPKFDELFHTYIYFYHCSITLYYDTRA